MEVVSRRPGSGVNSGDNDDVPSDSENEGAEAPGQDGPALKAAKAFGIGLGAIVATPFAIAGVGVLAAGATVWGAAKVLQGVGGLLAAGPEAAVRAAAGGRQAGEEARVREKKDKKGPREDTKHEK